MLTNKSGNGSAKTGRIAPGADAHPGPPGPWPGVRPKFFSFCSSFYLWIWINCWRRTWINCWRRINILLRDVAFCMLSIFPFIFSCIFWTVSLWTSILKTRPWVRLNPGSATARQYCTLVKNDVPSPDVQLWRSATVCVSCKRSNASPNSAVRKLLVM